MHLFPQQVSGISKGDESASNQQLHKVIMKNLSTFRLHITYSCCRYSEGIILGLPKLKYRIDSVMRVLLIEVQKCWVKRDLWRGGIFARSFSSSRSNTQCINAGSLKPTFIVFFNSSGIAYSIMSHRLFQLVVSECRTPPRSVSFWVECSASSALRYCRFSGTCSNAHVCDLHDFGTYLSSQYLRTWDLASSWAARGHEDLITGFT